MAEQNINGQAPVAAAASAVSASSAGRFFPTAWKNLPPPARRWRVGLLAEGRWGCWRLGSRWLGAAASKIHRNHTARLHRRSRHLPPSNRNETARVKHPGRRTTRYASPRATGSTDFEEFKLGSPLIRPWSCHSRRPRIQKVLLGCPAPR